MLTQLTFLLAIAVFLTFRPQHIGIVLALGIALAVWSMRAEHQSRLEEILGNGFLINVVVHICVLYIANRAGFRINANRP